MTDEVERKEVLPLPEVVTSFREDIKDAIDWEVYGTPGSFGVETNISAGTMSVPFLDDELSRYTRSRELMRARITPVNDDTVNAFVHHYKGKITVDQLKSAEELRISLMTTKIDQFDPGQLIDGSEKILGARLATAGTPQAWDIAMLKASELVAVPKAFDSFAAGVRSVRPEWSKTLRELRKRLDSAMSKRPYDLGSTRPVEFQPDDYLDPIIMPDGYQYTVQAAGVMANYSSRGYYSPKDVQESKKSDDDKKATDYGDDDDSEIVDESNPSCESDKKLDVRRMPMDFDFPTDGVGEFASLNIDETMPLSIEVSGYLHRKKNALATGKRVLYPGRLYTDPQRRIFGSKVKVKGGVLIIDISGSMNLTNEDIEAILEVAPAAYIMAYSHRQDSEPNAWVLANRGWRVAPDRIGDIGRSGNGVDGPALTHAIRKRKQNESIVWVSDGMVTTKNDGFSVELALECAKLVKKHRIIMLPNVTSAVKAFRSGRMINQPAGPIREALLNGQLKGW